MRGVDCIAVSDPDQVNGLLGCVDLRLQIQKELLPAVVFDKIVSRAAWIAPDRRLRKTNRAVDNLVQRSVPTAGIEADRFGVLAAVVADICGRVPGALVS